MSDFEIAHHQDNWTDSARIIPTFTRRDKKLIGTRLFRRAFTCYPEDGWWSALLAGSRAGVASPAIIRASLRHLRPSSNSRLLGATGSQHLYQPCSRSTERGAVQVITDYGMSLPVGIFVRSPSGTICTLFHPLTRQRWKRREHGASPLPASHKRTAY